MNKLSSIFLVLLFTQIISAQITANNSTFTVDQLIDGVLFEDGCTPITNIQFSTGTGIDKNGIAYFDRNGSSFPINDGIILSTGNALFAVGPNTLAESTDNLLSGSDVDLETVMAAAGSPINSVDATWISFDFTPISDLISFDYIFASEEYNGSFECTFADAFAFILTDSVTGAVTNLATIPGSNLPVQVVTVRDPPPGTCASINPNFFQQYNLNNNGFGIISLGSSAATSATEFNGQTTRLTAMSNVVPNRGYNIKLVIADADDFELDSAVFIEGGSFEIGVDIGTSRIISRGNPLCYGEQYSLDASLTLLPGTTASYVWQESGNVIPGETSAVLDITDNGRYSVEITFSNGCTANALVNLEFVELPETSPPDVLSCDINGFGSYNLNIIEGIMLDGLRAADYTVGFYQSEIDAQNQVNQVPTVSNYQGISNPQTLFVRVVHNTFGCEVIYPFQLIVEDVFAAPVQDVSTCDDDSDGLATFLLSDFDSLVAPNYTSGTVTISYFSTQANADTNMNPLGNMFTNTSSPETIYARVVTSNDINCFDTTSINVFVNQKPQAAQSIDDLMLCDDLNTGDRVEVFDLTSIENDIIGAQDFTDVSISFHTSLADADNDIAPIVNPSTFENNVLSSQNIFVRLENNSSGCFNTDTVFDLIVNEVPAVTSPLVYDLCDDNVNDSFTEFDLGSRNNTITGNNNNVTVSYFDSQLNANNRVNRLPSLYTNTVNPQIIFVIIENPTTGCFNSTTLTLEVIDAPQAIMPPDFVVCDDTNTGDARESFDLTANEAIIINGQPNVNTTYYLSMVDATSNINDIVDSTSFINSITPQTIYARVENNTGCFNLTQFDLVVNEVPIPQLFDLYYLCLDSAGNILNTGDSPPTLITGLNPSGLNFTWELNGMVLNAETSENLTAISIGMYTVTATNQITGCSTSQTTEVRQLGSPDDFGAQVTTSYFEQRHRIVAFATGPARQYIFRLDDGPWQFNGNFDNVSPGLRTIEIQDLEGCASVEITLNVIGYPLYFTPNNDGYHDTWNIIGLNETSGTIIYIFDRYGKLLKQLSPSGIGWDGTYNGQPLPSSDYWFKVENKENDTPNSFSGHFTLKR